MVVAVFVLLTANQPQCRIRSGFVDSLIRWGGPEIAPTNAGLKRKCPAARLHRAGYNSDSLASLFSIATIL
jgi:hypothetical protein